MRGAIAALDARDSEILAERVTAYNTHAQPRVGDFVRFADGTLRRISHDWFGESLQTSDGGSFYLGNGYLSFSGSLYRGISPETLTLTDETREGGAWFFHHDQHQAHSGVDVRVSLRVYACTLDAQPF